MNARSIAPVWGLPKGARELDVEWTANQFDAHDETLALVPLKPEELWEAPASGSGRAHGLIAGIFRPIFQMERTFSIAMAREHIPSLCLPPEQIAVLPLLCKALPLERVASLWQDRAQLQAVFDLPELGPVAHEIVLAPTDRPERFDLPRTTFSMHLLPGVAGLWQCGAHAGQNKFHPSGRFAWRFAEEAAFVSDGSRERRFADWRLPGRISAAEIPCACGQTATVSLL